MLTGVIEKRKKNGYSEESLSHGKMSFAMSIKKYSLNSHNRQDLPANLSDGRVDMSKFGNDSMTTTLLFPKINSNQKKAGHLIFFSLSKNKIDSEISFMSNSIRKMIKEPNEDEEEVIELKPEIKRKAA